MNQTPSQQTPLFQLNLMIWMALPSKGGNIVPILHEWGFHLLRISQSLPVDPITFNRVMNADIPIKQAPGPDLLLRQFDKETIVHLECKVNSFGPIATGKKHQAHQANGLLCLDGPHIADFLGLRNPSNWDGHVLYAVSGPQEEEQQQTLDNLCQELNTVPVTTLENGTLGIYLEDDGVYITACPSGKYPFSLSTGNRWLVIGGDSDTDLRPLYLIPYDPSVGPADEYEKRSVEERIRAALAHLVVTQTYKKSISFSKNDLAKATFEVWDMWKDSNSKKHIVKRVNRYRNRIINELLEYLKNHGEKPEVTFARGKVTITKINQRSAELIQRYFMSASYRRGDVDVWKIEQLDLGMDEV